LVSRPERVVAFAVLAATLAYLFTKVLEKTGDERRALLYTAIFFKFMVLLMMLLGLDTTLFHIVVYRRVGAAVVRRAEIPITAGMLALIASFSALLVGLGILDHIKALIPNEKQVGE